QLLSSHFCLGAESFSNPKMICAAQRARQPLGAHINAHTNAHIIFPRTSVTSEMARTPFWRLRTSFACAACHCASAAAARLARNYPSQVCWAPKASKLEQWHGSKVG